MKVLILSLLVAALRVFKASVFWVGGANFFPAMGLSYAGGTVAKSNWIPILGMAIADTIMMSLGIVPFDWAGRVVLYGMMILAFWSGRKDSKKENPWKGQLAWTLGYYLISSTAAWVANPAYQKTLSGWFAALTWGEPGYLPAFLFLFASLMADFVFFFVVHLLRIQDYGIKKTVSI